jgi:transposase
VASKRRRFDPEFRAGAVRIVKETGKPVAQVARDLGINPYTLNNWMHMDRLAAQHDNGNAVTMESEQEELARLRREKTELARELAREKAAWEKERAELEDERDDAPMVVKQRWSKSVLVTGLQG